MAWVQFSACCRDIYLDKRPTAIFAARRPRRGAFSHVVAYNRQTLVLRGMADTLLDTASYGSRWVLLSPAPAAGLARALRPRAPRP